ncbi:porin family protein [Labilibacter marinus]|uniref:porin family protein n=1 Tax=Labilibacter marinus TaxID=1477105 RepID=UPI00083713C7|nr:porin family protein [Labilibacter marinus]
MKKVLLSIAFVLIAASSHSQVLISLLLGDKLNSDGLEFGLEGGLNWSGISGMESNALVRNLNIGFYFDIKLKDQIYLYTGVLVKSNVGFDKLEPEDLDFLGIEQQPEDGEYKQVINKFMVPVLAKYKFKNRLYIEAGPQFGLVHGGLVEFNSDTNGQEIRIRQDNSSMLRRIDAGMSGGFGYKLKENTGMTIGVRYYQGFVDVYKDRSGTLNNSINVKINIPVGANKSKKEKSL